MKTKFVLNYLIITLFSGSIYAQIDTLNLREYFLVSKYNDTVSFYGKKQDVAHLEYGFRIYNKNGEKTTHNIKPDNYKYLYFYDENKEFILLKSLKPIRFMNSHTGNSFMRVVIENSQLDLEKGKINFFIHEYPSSGGGYGFNGSGNWTYAHGNESNNFTVFYFESREGFNRCYYANDFKQNSLILGKDLYKKMKKSDNEIRFMTDFFNNYNNSIKP